MKSAHGEKMALCSVHMEGQVNGLLLSTSIRQQYRNDSGKALEIVYTFPVGHGASLLGMEADIGGKRLKAAVIEKRQAEQKYEEALDEGDTPIMVQESSPGLYTANLGNIKDGESISIKIHCAQLLRFEQGRIRIKIPTVIAPRYGDMHGEGCLAPHETAITDLAAEYPLTASIHIFGEMAKARIGSPSHKVSLVPGEDGVTALLESGARLDRDFILLLEGLAGHAFAVSAHDDEEHTVLASFCPRLPQADEPLALKILVDCSGSMAGDSIHEALKALETVCEALTSADHLSYSRFGSTVRHEMRVMQACTGPVRNRFRRAIAATNADMGGTEMNQALRAVIGEISAPAPLRPCILLITDDLTWDAGHILQTCLDSGHRIFAVGVGSAPAETLLRDMCERTGGACEFVTPNEEVSAAAMRMIRKMKGAQPGNMHIAWGAKPRWQSSLPLSMFDGETLHVFATFAETPVKTPELYWENNGQTTCARAEKLDVAENCDLIRLGAARRILQADTEDALALALKHQLVSARTSLFLAYLRAGEDKVTELPELRQVPQMMAAGSHGYGSVQECYNRPMSMACREEPPMFMFDSICDKVGDQYSVPAYLRIEKINSLLPEIEGDSFLPELERLNPIKLLESFDRMVVTRGNKHVGEIVSWLASSFTSLKAFTDQLGHQEGVSSQMVWVALIDWLLDRSVKTYTPARQTRRLLRAELKNLETEQKDSLHIAFKLMWPSI